VTGGKPSITAIILSFNEEVHIGRCIERLWPVVERIVVIDSYSSDRTVEIAKALGAEVLQNAWSNHANQFNWGLANAGVTTDWIMRIDCDEYLEDGLLHALQNDIPSMPATVTACDFKLKVVFQGKFIRWGGYYRTWLTRLWRTGMGHYESRWMDEKIVVQEGDRRRLTGGDLVDENLKDLTWWTGKHNDYATRQMIDYINREHQLLQTADPLASDANRAIRHKRMLRSAYAGMPLYLRAVAYFILRYILRLGFLDGRKGFVWHTLQGFWYFLLVDAKVDEARAFIAKNGIDAFRSHVAHRHGFADLAPCPDNEQVHR
jgi:glycosyltransferase involved in cell wall biosynthesis